MVHHTDESHSHAETLPFPSSTGSTCHGSTPPSCVFRWLQAFSLQTTSQGVFSTSSTIQGGSYSSLNGIRVLSLLWIMSGHSTELILAGLGMHQDTQSSYWFRSCSVWVLMVNSVNFRQQSQLDKCRHEQPPVRALLGWAFFSGRGHFFISRVRKHSFRLRRSHFGHIQSGLKRYYDQRWYVSALHAPLLFCWRGLLSARSLLGAIERAEDQLSPSLVAVYLFNRIKRFC